MCSGVCCQDMNTVSMVIMSLQADRPSALCVGPCNLRSAKNTFGMTHGSQSSGVCLGLQRT